jgi:DNA replication protein DnaC
LSGRGLAACQKGFTVAFTTAAALVSQLLEARDERRLLKLQRDLASVKLLIIDELGYAPHLAAAKGRGRSLCRDPDRCQRTRYGRDFAQ